MGLSGIIAVFISGIIHSHYSLHSLAPTATATLPLLFEPLATIAELFTFVYMGFQPFVGDLRWDWGLIASAVPLGLLARAANIVPLTATLRGLCGVSVPWKVQVMQILSGARGCMAYALVINMPSIKSEGLANESGNPYLGELCSPSLLRERDCPTLPLSYSSAPSLSYSPNLLLSRRGRDALPRDGNHHRRRRGNGPRAAHAGPRLRRSDG